MSLSRRNFLKSLILIPIIPLVSGGSKASSKMASKPLERDKNLIGYLRSGDVWTPVYSFRDKKLQGLEADRWFIDEDPKFYKYISPGWVSIEI